MEGLSCGESDATVPEERTRVRRRLLPLSVRVPLASIGPGGRCFGDDCAKSVQGLMLNASPIASVKLTKVVRCRDEEAIMGSSRESVALTEFIVFTSAYFFVC